MRDNFRPNIRLATNILLVMGTFAVALNIAPISKRAKLENLCKEIQYTWHREFKKDSYLDSKKTTEWYLKRRRILNKKIIKLTGMKYVKNTMYSTQICNFQIDDLNKMYL